MNGTYSTLRNINDEKFVFDLGLSEGYPQPHILKLSNHLSVLHIFQQAPQPNISRSRSRRPRRPVGPSTPPLLHPDNLLPPHTLPPRLILLSPMRHRLPNLRLPIIKARTPRPTPRPLSLPVPHRTAPLRRPIFCRERRSRTKCIASTRFARTLYATRWTRAT